EFDEREAEQTLIELDGSFDIRTDQRGVVDAAPGGRLPFGGRAQIFGAQLRSAGFELNQFRLGWHGWNLSNSVVWRPTPLCDVRRGCVARTCPDRIPRGSRASGACRPEDPYRMSRLTRGTELCPQHLRRAGHRTHLADRRLPRQVLHAAVGRDDDV